MGPAAGVRHSGYWLNHYRAEPKLHIEYVTPVMIVENAAPDWKAVEVVRHDTRVSALLRSMLLSSQHTKESSRYCAGWLDRNEWFDDCASEVNTTVEYHIGFMNARISELQTAIADMKQGRVPAPMMTVADFFPNLALKDRQRAEAGMKAALENSKEMLSTLNILHKVLVAANGTTGPRTGAVEVRVGVLNVGDSDGVIKRGGALRFGDSEVMLHATNYTVVKAHSFAQIEFGENGAATTRAHLEKLHGLIRARGQDPFTVRIFAGESILEGRRGSQSSVARRAPA